jgi:RNA polymerase sigma-70 factor (ECF subfamily)
MEEQPRACVLQDMVEQHYALLYRYAYRLSGSGSDAEDLTQQTFLTAQAKLDQLRDHSHAKGWLCAILRNHYLKNVRHTGGRMLLSLDRIPEPSESIHTDQPIDSDALQTAINEMPEEFRTPIILFYFEEFTYQEIADQMEVPLGTVMSRLARAKAHLRRRLLALEPALTDQ